MCIGKTYTRTVRALSKEQTSWALFKTEMWVRCPPLPPLRHTPLSGARRKTRRDKRAEEQEEEEGRMDDEPTATVIYFERRSIKVKPSRA